MENSLAHEVSHLISGLVLTWGGGAGEEGKGSAKIVLGPVGDFLHVLFCNSVGLFISFY